KRPRRRSEEQAEQNMEDRVRQLSKRRTREELASDGPQPEEEANGFEDAAGKAEQEEKENEDDEAGEEGEEEAVDAGLELSMAGDFQDRYRRRCAAFCATSRWRLARSFLFRTGCRAAFYLSSEFSTRW